ncbi:hypothetical protein CGCVW01_v013247 [Colletotrichum viniferum]|nr:hypothetical protein CGCVW01_v013247 [Colletotrichum viniferum]
MGKSKMDDAAAARIRKARGDKDDFAKRATMAAQANRDREASSREQKGGYSGSGRTSRRLTEERGSMKDTGKESWAGQVRRVSLVSCTFHEGYGGEEKREY